MDISTKTKHNKIHIILKKAQQKTNHKFLMKKTIKIIIEIKFKAFKDLTKIKIITNKNKNKVKDICKTKIIRSFLKVHTNYSQLAIYNNIPVYQISNKKKTITQ